MTEYNYEDIERLPINEEDPQLCQILYTDEYKETMGLLRALLVKEEYSQRALDITDRAISLNAAHYTVWNYRYNIVKSLGLDLNEELEWSETVALNNPKNYQIWPYRQLVIESLKDFNPQREYPILQAMLEEDTKNHHAWSHRKWLVQKFSLFNDRELSFTEAFLSADIRNNSAWSHRFFISFGQAILDKKSPDVLVVERELKFTKDAIEKAPQNPSSWNYLIGIYNLLHKQFDDLEFFCKKYSSYDVEDDIEPIIESIYALEILAKIYATQNPNKSIQIYDLLGSKYDPIRENYWNYEKSKIIV